ncbi:MAG: hypothetical protein HXY24_10495, partial [Rubrivivax sp.]|nr:hypothetical protein [Rubrivivax sp.]
MHKSLLYKNILFRFREWVWGYPARLFSEKGIFFNLVLFYKAVSPFSHIVVFGSILAFIGYLNFNDIFAFTRIQKIEIREGVIVGDSNLNRINPLLPTTNQIENDLSNLIYLPLIKLSPEGEVYGVLSQSWEDSDGTGREYLFKLREDVVWHNGKRFTSDDVIATFNVIKQLGESQEFSISKFSDAAKGMNLERIDDFNVKFILEEVNPTFFEDISWGVMPEDMLSDLSISTFSWADFNLNPVGTGPFIFKGYKDNLITFTANRDFFLGKPQFDIFKVVLFEKADDAIEALKNGEIHILADPSSQVLEDLDFWQKIDVIKSPVIYRRYWALYFNLKEDGPQNYKDKRVRQAISSAIDRQKILSNIETAGEEALGPIPRNSWAYNSEAKRYGYDPIEAKDLLSQAGWVIKSVEGEILWMKDEEILRIKISYLDKYERHIVAESIKSDLEKIGIKVQLDPKSNTDLNEALIATRNFDVVLYGVETPMDPDRIRLWHSDAIAYPGLNISSYVPEQKGAVISEEKELERISIVDVALENGRANLDRIKRLGSEG